jgi:hypothetical protein
VTDKKEKRPPQQNSWAKGREKFSVTYSAFRRLLDGRLFSFLRADLERVLYMKVKAGVELRFGITVESFRQAERVRELAFGKAKQFARFLGFYTAVFILPDRPSLVRADALSTLTLPGRQVGVGPIRTRMSQGDSCRQSTSCWRRFTSWPLW